VSDIVPWQNPRSDPGKPGAKVIRTAFETNARGWFQAWWPALFWAVVIFTMSTDTFSAQHTARFIEPIVRWFKPDLTSHEFLAIHHYIRKCAHFTEYFVFCLLLYRGVRGAQVGWRWTWGLSALFIAASYSALDEIHQAFVASRQASPYDSLLDSIGAFIAMVILWLWLRSRRQANPVPVTGRQ
jgi:VanZ family protein